MNHPASSPPKPSPTSKRRGRPRSPVFAYFRRVVDEKGAFVGNECQFCSFVSKDRSENPTYLTRHILRTCSAPQHIKDTIGVRHPSIAISNYSTSPRFIPPKSTSPFSPSTDPASATVAAAVAANNALNGRRTTKHKSRPHLQSPPAPTPPSLHNHQPTPQFTPTTAASAPPNPVPIPMAPAPLTQPLPTSASISSALTASALHPSKTPQRKQRQIAHKSSKAAVSRSTPPPYPVSQPRPTTTSYPIPSVHVQSATASVAPAATAPHTPSIGGGVGKSRRGRPRSPALMHFRRHTDDKGNFIANQCSFCPFVSRDRSENSTLLLRHLLSVSCACPESMKVVLRGTKYTPDGKRVKKDGKATDSKVKKNTALKSEAGRSEAAKTAGNGAFMQTPMAQGYAVNPSLVSASVVRFFTRHCIDLGAVGSPLFQDMVQAIAATGAPNGMMDAAANLGQNMAALTGKQGKILPSRAELESFWKTIPHTQLLKSESASRQAYSRATNLLIYFPYSAGPVDLRTSTGPYSEPNGITESVNPGLVASVFKWTADVELKYLGSKNCAGDLQSHLLAIIEKAQEDRGTQGKLKFDQIFIARPYLSTDKLCDIRQSDTGTIWIPDVAREVDILCQELLAQVPVLVRCMRRNKLLASFFREKYSESAAVVLFGRNAAEKERCNRYLKHISNTVRNPRCQDALKTALQTYEILRQTQSSHEEAQRLQETGSFLHTITEENTGSVQLCQEVTGLVLSIPYINELKVFISVMTPLANLISLYSSPRVSDGKGRGLSPASQISEDVFQDNDPFRNRSIAHMLPDCLRTLCELYTDKMTDFENDMRLLRAHTMQRLLGKGGNGVPPVIVDVCYLAALLNPNGELGTTKVISIEEAWRRAVSFLHRHYGTCTSFGLDRALEQLQAFHRRTGVFAAPEMFHDVRETEDPRRWWEKHGNVAPDLCALALKILGAPTTGFPVVQYIAEQNAHGAMGDERGKDAGGIEKERMVRWNLILKECRVGGQGM